MDMQLDYSPAGAIDAHSCNGKSSIYCELAG